MKNIARLGGESLYLAALALIVVVYASFLGDQLLAGKLLFSRGATTVNMTDFMHFYMAGDLALHPATRALVYDLATQLQWQRAFAHIPDLAQVFYYELPPPTLLMLAPLTNLPPIGAYIAFVGSSIAMILLSLALTAKIVRKNFWQSLLFFFGAFGSVPAYFASFHGQYSFLGFAFIALFYAGMMAGKNVMAGIGLGLLFFRPQYQIFLGLILLLQKRWKAIAVGVGITLALYLASGLFIGFDNIVNYPRTLWNSQLDSRIGAQSSVGEECIRGLLSQFLPQAVAIPVSTLFSLLAMVCSAWVLKQSRSEVEKRLAIAISVVSMLLFGVHTHLHDWLIGSLAAWFAFGKNSGITLKSPNMLIRAWYLECLAYPFLTWTNFGLTIAKIVPPQNRSLGFDLIHAVLLGTLIAAFVVERRRPLARDVEAQTA